MNTKTEAIKLFGDTLSLAQTLGITRQAIYQWNEQLTQQHIDQVIGAAVRTGRIKTVKDETVEG